MASLVGLPPIPRSTDWPPPGSTWWRFQEPDGGSGRSPSAVRRCPGDGGPRRPTFPPVTVVVSCDLVVRGPDVAPAVTTLEGYPPPMAFHRWASDASAGLSRHVRASILIPTAAKAPRISRRMMIQITGGFLLPPSRASLEQPAPRVSGALVTALAPPVWRVRSVPRQRGCRERSPICDHRGSCLPCSTRPIDPCPRVRVTRTAMRSHRAGQPAGAPSPSRLAVMCCSTSTVARYSSRVTPSTSRRRVTSTCSASLARVAAPAAVSA